MSQMIILYQYFVADGNKQQQNSSLPSRLNNDQGIRVDEQQQNSSLPSMLNNDQGIATY